MVDRRELQKKRPKMEQRKQRDERKEYERIRKVCQEKSIQTQNWVYEGHSRHKMEEVSNPLCPFCNTYLFGDHILGECKETENQRKTMNMRKKQWINGKKGMEKINDYAKENGLYNGI
jgi:hypothetical protein